MSHEGERLFLLPEAPPEGARFLRFGVYELELASGELRRAGVLVKLRHQPAKVLIHLASRPGRVVTRDELRAAVWDGDTFVDFDQGLNYCIKEIRAAISDSAETPLYVETLPRRGYRFIAPVEKVGETAVAAPMPVLAAAAPLRPRRWAGRVSTLAAALALLGLAAAGLLALRPSAPPPSWQRVTFRRGSLSSARFAPGGEIVSSASWDGGPPALYAALAGAPDARPLSVPGRLVNVSARGEVAFIQAGAGVPPVLARMPLAGGPVRPLLEGVLEADGTADGSAFAVVRVAPGRGAQVEYPIGRALAQVNAPSHLRLAPGGARLAFIEHPRTGDDLGHVVVLGEGGAVLARSRSFASAEGLAWPPTGDEVWFTAAEAGGSFALRALDLRGHERTLLSAAGRLVLHDVAPDGRVLLDRVVARGEVEFVGPDGAASDLGWFDAPQVIALSADGARLLFSESGEAGGPDYGVYVRDTAPPSAPVRLGSGVPGSLTPDGCCAVVVPLREPDHIDLLPIGPGETRHVRHPGIVQYEWAALTPDGARLVFVGRQEGHNLRVWVSPAAGGAPAPITPDGLIVSRDTIAPDGRALWAPCAPRAFCVYPLDGAAPRPIPGLAGALPVAWEPGGRALYVRSPAGPARVVVERLDLATGARTPLRALAPRDPVGVGALGRVVWSRDGRALAFGYTRRLSDLYVATGPR